MDINLFSNTQIEYMYSDSGFLSFINHYFSTFLSCAQDIDYFLEHDRWPDEEFEIYLRIVLANLGILRQDISEIERQLSSAYAVTEREYVGEIHGKLDVDKYVRRIAEKRSPKEYPCQIKSRTLVTPENVYVIFIIDYVSRLLVSFQRYLRKKFESDGTKYREVALINEHLMAFRAFSQKGYFMECIPEVNKIRVNYGDQFPASVYNTIINRIRKGKVRNPRAYQKIFDWFQMFKKGSVLFVGESNISILRYSDEFANKLFELWCLYTLKETFIREFGATLIEEKDIMSVGDSYIFKLSAATGGVLELYYQKGALLYWKDDSELSWKYIKEDGSKKGLRGIPDISVRYVTAIDSIVMIDIKNRTRSSGQNSEEIYKMIGYFSNFRHAFEKVYCNNVKRQGALIFRNDEISFYEQLESNNDYKLMALSVSPTADDELNLKQFRILCKYVFDLQGMDGSTADILGSYARSVRNTSASELSVDDREYAISEENDQTISRMFVSGELAKELPKYTEQLRSNHFPHIWTDLSPNSIRIMAMAECLYNGTSSCELADYAPLCLEYCRALEVQLNELIFTPFKTANNILRLSVTNHYYEKLQLNRELTLGECIYLLEKCNHPYHPMMELKRFIVANVKKANLLFAQGVPIMRDINESVRRKSAHTSIMDYEELVNTRQLLLGIGNLNLFYTLLDKR